MRKSVIWTLFLALGVLHACSVTQPTASAPTNPPPPPPPPPPPVAEAVEETLGQEVQSAGVPAILFDTPVKDFGEVIKGQKKPYSFYFTNSGSADLVIELATACTCTSLDWPRKPIPPGGRGRIDVVFDSSTKEGVVNVDVDIIGNMEPIVSTAVIKAFVVPDDQ